MFDRLIESEPEGADFKNRRGFFIMSTVVVGILFLAAVVVSIYAADFSLGNDRIELEAMLAPVDMAAAATEPQKPQLPSTAGRSQSDVPIRIENMSRTDESTIVPIGISTERNPTMARPVGEFQIGKENTNPIGSGRDVGPVGASEVVGLGKIQQPAQTDTEQDPPPFKTPDIKKPAVVQTLGVVNGRASYLPKPVYPAAAIAVNAQGAVNVQVMIDETGRVVAANASGGHSLLRNAAEQAARNARFTPTLLSKVPVKVTGVIVYNFSR